MIATARSLFIILLGPPLVLLFWAHLIRPAWSRSDWLALIAAALTGVLGIATARWPEAVKLGAAGVWVAITILWLPYLGLIAVCTTGDCL